MDLENEINQLKNNQNINYQQLSELLIMNVNLQNTVNNMIQIINSQSQLLNEMNQKFQTTLYKLADIEIGQNTIDNNLSEVFEIIQQMPTDLLDISSKIDNIRIYKMVDQI